MIYSLETETYEVVTDVGTFPRWLSDSRRLLFSLSGNLSLVDTRRGETTEILSAAPDFIGGSVSPTADDRQIYLNIVSVEADV